MSITAPGMGLPVVREAMVPCMRVVRPLGGMSWIIVAPRERKGAWADQKGPRIEEEVGWAPLGVEVGGRVLAISSTRLYKNK